VAADFQESASGMVNWLKWLEFQHNLSTVLRMSTDAGKRMLSWATFWASVAVVSGLAGVYLYNIILWADYPDFGFGFRTATGMGVVGVVTDHGYREGLRVGDRLLKVNGKPFTTIQAVRTSVNRALGEENIYEIEREGVLLRVTVRNGPVGLAESFNRSGFLYILGLCYMAIGVVVFLMKPHSSVSWVFFLFTAVLGVFIAFLYKISRMSPLWMETIQVFVYCFCPAAFVHLAGTFPQERVVFKRYPGAQLIPYITSALLFLFILSRTTTITDAPRVWLLVAIIYIALGILLFIGSCLEIWLRSASEIARLRAKMILLGASISVSIPLADLLSSSLMNTYLLPGFNYYVPFFVVFPIFVAYCIVKHDLFDIDAIIKRTYGYVLTTGLVAGAYGLFVLVSNLLFGEFEFARSPLFPILFILAVAFLFNPARNRVQRLIDRVFYRLEYDYQKTVHKISETMRSLIGLDEVGKSIMDLALGTMFIDSGSVLLVNRSKEGYAPLIRFREPDPRSKLLARHSGGGAVENKATEDKERVPSADLYGMPEFKILADDPLIQKMTERKKELTIHDIQEDPFFEDNRTACLRSFENLGATLLVPLIYENRLTGLISLGRKKSGKYYRKEDVNLLTILANQGAVAIENALMIEDVIEKERMEEELSIARDLQMSMLPASCPKVPRFDIAALCIPAREVGGDFFDFIEMGEGRLGLIVGDVTGKSVSGALVMSAARSIFRMLSEEQWSVADIMGRANRRAKKDIKSGMFVALLYAVMDSTEKSLSLCSAGQTQPVHFSAEKGKALLVETEGDTFPLGILEEADYKETRLQLAPGDKVVFYTDGIVEAMNKEQEIFGFERLQKVVEATQSMNAEAVLKEIMEKVNRFVGNAPQHDDLTAIVVTVTE
jgi:serine phosphatase RsbU (regulator of sigma subunit)